jgi:tetratricopeptide (TPR) repeat protein
MIGSSRALKTFVGIVVLLLGGMPWRAPMARSEEAPAKKEAAAKKESPVAPKPSTPAAKPKTAETKDLPAGTRDELSAYLAQYGDDIPKPFVPLRPSSVNDRRRQESVRLYTAARALEDQRSWDQAVVLLQQALKLEPESLAIAKRLTRIYAGALGRADLAAQFGKRALMMDPDDTESLNLLVDFYNKKGDAAALELLLNELLANPKLSEHSPARMLVNFELGRLYSTRIKEPTKAAEALARVLEALDDKSANRLSPADQARVLGNDPAAAYLNFGLTFLITKRYELAVKAFERGLIYDDENAQLSLLLSETLLKLNRGNEALGLVERYIKRQRGSVEAFELLAKVLTSLHREKEITVRLEEAIKKDPANVSLKYVLADRYRESGDAEKADKLYDELLKSRPTPQTYRALATSLYRRKKSGDLLRVICDALANPNAKDAVIPTLQAVAMDDGMTESIIDSGCELLSKGGLPATKLDDVLRVLATLANFDRPAAAKKQRLEKLLRFQSLYVDKFPQPASYIELADTQRRLGKNGDAAGTVEKLFAKYPEQKTSRYLLLLATYLRRAGRADAAKATIADALKRGGADDGESQAQVATLLSELGQVDEAVSILKNVMKREPGNFQYNFMLSGILSKYARYDDAAKVLEDLIKRGSDNEDILKLAHSSLSAVYVSQGNYAKGEAELELLLERNPDEPGPNNDLGYLLAEQGKSLERAELMVRKALQEDPDNYAYLDSLGWVLFKRGKAKDAIEPLIKAVEKMKSESEKMGSTPDATLFEHLGDVYFHLQQVEKAGEIWTQAVKAAEQAVPPDKRLKEIQKKLDTLLNLVPSLKSPKAKTP